MNIIWSLGNQKGQLYLIINILLFLSFEVSSAMLDEMFHVFAF